MIFAIEGVDCVGKTTLCQLLREVGYTVTKTPTPRITSKPGYPESVDACDYFYDHRSSVDRSSHRDIHDRCILSTMIYQQLSKLSVYDRELAKFTKVFVLTPPSIAFIKHLVAAKEGKDMFEKDEELQVRIYTEYYGREGLVEGLGNVERIYTHTTKGVRKSAPDLAIEIISHIVLCEIGDFK